MGKVISIVSGKGGVGKTTLTANLGAAFSLQNKKTLIIDMDIGLRNLDIILGLDDVIVYDFVDVLENKCTLSDAVFESSKFKNLKFLPAPQTIIEYQFEENILKSFLEGLKDSFDYILIDSPAGIGDGFKNAIIYADMILVVLTPEMSSIRDADRAISIIEDTNHAEVKLIINRVRPNMIKQGTMINIDTILDLIGITPIGIIPEDDFVISCVTRGDLPVIESLSTSREEFLNIAKRIDGEDIPVTVFNQDLSFLKKLKKMLWK